MRASCSVAWSWSSASSAGRASACCSSRRSSVRTTRCCWRGWRSRRSSSCCAICSQTFSTACSIPASGYADGRHECHEVARMSMRVGDESGRARAEALDAGLIAPEIVSAVGGAQWRRALRRFRRHRVAMAALVFLVFMVLACYVGAQFAPSPTEQHLLRAPTGPTTSHWFGTDELSRDELSRVLHGGQISLRVAFGVAIVSTILGVIIGSFAGFYRGWIDGLLMRFTDLWIALPALPILAVAVSIGSIDLGPLGTLDLGSPFGITL